MKDHKIVCGMMAMLFAVSFSSCAFLENSQTDMQAQLDALNAKIEQQAQEINGLKVDKEMMDQYYEVNASFGVFCNLETAYEYGVLTKDDLMSIAYYQLGGRYKNEDIMPEDYVPQPKTPETIDIVTQREMFETYIDMYSLSCKASQLKVDQYHGAYHGVYVVRIDGPWGGTCEVYHEKIGGVTFAKGGFITLNVYIPEYVYPEIVAQIRQDRLENNQ